MTGMVEEICRCGKKLTLIREYNRYFCHRCRTYPPTCSDCRRDLFWIPMYSLYYCNSCMSYKEPTEPATPLGAAVRPTPSRKRSRKEIEAAFNELRGRYQGGSIDKARYNEALEKMKFKDDHGRYWTIGARTGKWYYYDGIRWTESEPPQTLEGETHYASEGSEPI